MLDEARVVLTRAVAQAPPEVPKKRLDKLMIECQIQGKTALIYVDFKEPIMIAEFPRLTVECPDGLFDSISGQIWQNDDEEEKPNLAESIELLEEDDDDDDGSDDDDDEDDE